MKINNILVGHMHILHDDYSSKACCDCIIAATPFKSKEQFFCFKNIDEMLGHCVDHKITQLYFQDYNFEVQYVVWWLIKNKYKHTYAHDFNFDGRGAYKIYRRRDGKIYYLTIFIKLEDRSQRKIEIRSLKLKTGSTIEELSEPFTGEYLDLDDETIQENHHPDQETIKAMANYVNVMAKTIWHLNKHKMTELTLARDAMSYFIFEKYKKKNEDDNDENKDDNNEKHKSRKKVNPYIDLFPQISDEYEKQLRLAYRGGFTYLATRCRNKHLKHGGKVYDINSMYPWVMHTFPMPCGTPHFYSLKDVTFQSEYQGISLPFDIHEYVVYHIHVDAKLKQGGIPCISVKGIQNSNTEVVENKYVGNLKNANIWVTNFDLELMIQNYDVNNYTLEFKECYTFNTCTTVFDEYVDYWFNIKSNKTGAEKEIAKLMLNALYGKFGAASEKEQTLPVIQDGVLNWITPEKNKADEAVKQYKKYNLVSTIRYLPLSLFITSIARHRLINDILKNKSQFIYCDTDSIHLLGDAVGLDIGDGLGQYKIEKTFTDAKYISEKTYCLLLDEYDKETGKQLYSVKVSGANKLVQKQINFDNFKPGFTIKTGKFYFKQIKGGVLRTNTSFKLGKDMEDDEL